MAAGRRNDIAGQTGSTYLVTEGDEGHHLDVIATSTNDNGVTTSATSATTDSVLDALPTITTPEVSGEAREGDTLTASASSGQDDNAVTYQWQQDGVNIAGATGSTYTATEANEGHKLDVIATATNDDGVTTSATSAPTAAVLDALPTISTPVITGDAREGQILTASAHSSQDDNAVTYQWQLDGVDISGATGATYTATEGDEGHTIDVIATATNDNGVQTSATSDSTDSVLDALPTITTPTIDGEAREGETLTASAHSGQDDNDVTYQWQLDGNDIAGADRLDLPGHRRRRGHTIST